MLLTKEKINAQLLFAISFSVTALAIYLFKIESLGGVTVLHHNFIQNVLFINITFLGSCIFCIGLILYLFYRKKKFIAWLITCNTFISILIIQGIKNYLHKDGVHIFFEDEQYIFNAVSQNTLTAFLSGHTAIAFSLATSLSLYFNNRKSLLLFTIAGIVAYSRIYLGHHTLPDLFAGAFTGLASGTFSFYCSLNFSKVKKHLFSITQRFNKPRMPENPYSFE